MVNSYTKFWQASKDTVLYCNGDSFTWGTGIGNLYHSPMFAYDQFKKSRLENSWPGQLSQITDCDFINDAWAGGSNDRICRRTKQFINEIDDCARVKVIICWSTPLRTEHKRLTLPDDTKVRYLKQGRTGPYDRHGKYTYVQMHHSGLTSPTCITEQDKNILKDFFMKHSNADLLVRFIEQVIDMQNFLKENNVDYIFFNAFGFKELYKEHVQDARIYPLLDKMDFDRFMGWPDEDFCVWSYMEYGEDKLDSGHLGVASHKHMAVLLKDKLKELYDNGCECIVSRCGCGYVKR